MGAVEDSGGTFLEDQLVAKVTDPGRAIGVCSQATAASATSVIATLTSSWAASIGGHRLERLGVTPSPTAEYTALSVDKTFFVAPRACRVKAITGRVTVAGADAGAVTAVVRKVPSGTAITSGTALHSGTFNLKGTADTNQALTLSTTASDIELAAGDALAVDFTGTLTSATGSISVGLAWL